jgi:5'-3' exoribonuclease 1
VLLEGVKSLLNKTTPMLSLQHNALPQSDREFVVRLARELGLFVKTSMECGEKLIFITRQPIIQRDDATEEDEEDGSSSEEEEESLLARGRILKKYRLASTTADAGDDEFTAFKALYYRTKMGLGMDQLEPLLKSYLQGLQWVLFYYFRGVPSWSWYFPFHYAPFISDLADHFDKLIPTLGPFDASTPFKPFEQLMAVLPSRSCKLLPGPYHTLMTDPTSAIFDFYPEKFELDMNGKKNDWEAIVKIPFIDPVRLLTAMRSREAGLTDFERYRNSLVSAVECALVYLLGDVK